MCNYYQNVYHHASCQNPDEHFVHISLQGGPAGRCDAGPHERYVPIPGQCSACSHVSEVDNSRSLRLEYLLETAVKKHYNRPHTQFPTPRRPAPSTCSSFTDQEDEDDICEFAVAWDLPAALTGEHDPETFLFEAITFTRATYTVKGMSAEEYIRTEYGALGLVLVENLFSALYSPSNCYEDSTMKIYATRSLLDISLFRELTSLRDLVLWLCLSFVRPRPGQVCISSAAIVRDFVTLMPLHPLPPRYRAFGTGCWYDMLDTAVIAQDPRMEPSPDAWLEIDLALLAKMTDVTWRVVHDGGVLMRGPLTALTPVEALDGDHVVWYFEVKAHGGKYDSDSLKAVQVDWFKTLSMQRLRAAKALVG